MSARLAAIHNLEALAASKEVHYKVGLLSTCLGYSARQFQRLCRAEKGCSASKWLADVKMRKAIGEMGAGAQIKKIAAKVCFAPGGDFSRFFKHMNGVNPAEFKRREARKLKNRHKMSD